MSSENIFLYECECGPMVLFAKAESVFCKKCKKILKPRRISKKEAESIKGKRKTISK